MCGLVGVAGSCDANMKDVFNEMLLVDVLRGHHSTGAAVVKRYTDEVILAKAPMPSPMFITTKNYKDALSTVGLKVLMGHNRYATVGNHTEENAHPFKFDNLVGAHNGTLDLWNLKHLDDWAKFGTDSEALYNSVSKHGIKDTMAQLTGAWALTWYDNKFNTINMLRNHKRPLVYCYSEDQETLFWASESAMLDWILTRNKVKIFQNEIYLCEADKHYKWVVPEKFGTKFEKPVLSEVKERAFLAHKNFQWDKEAKNWKDDEQWFEGSEYGHWGGYSASQSSPLPFAAKPSPAKDFKEVPAKAKVDTSKFRPPYKDFYGTVITKPKFEELVTSCCVFCDEANSVWGDFILPLKDDEDGRKLYLCKECYDDDEIRQIVEHVM